MYYMDKHIRNALLVLGCSEKEIRLYLASYKLGSATIGDLAKAARLQRSTAYLIAESLLEKGLLLEDFKHYAKALVAVEPDVLMRMLAAKQRQVGRQNLALHDNLPELQALYRASEIRPRVQTFQGANGLLSVWRDILTAKGAISLWTNQEAETQLFSAEQHEQFIRERISRQLPMRVLAVNNPKGAALIAQDAAWMRQTKLLPPSVSFSAETYLYDHKVAVLDYHKDIIGIIIESEQVAEAQRAMFEMAWAQTA
jgi:sugar-specific transcriptional regulator TrmB